MIATNAMVVMRDLGITPVVWGRRERYLQIPDVLLVATHARRNAVEEVAGGLVEMAEQHAPELAGWVAAEAEQFLAVLPAPEPAESDAFLAELRSELPGEWADRAEAIYRRHLRSQGHGQRRRQSFDEFVVISHANTIRRCPGPYSLGPTGSQGGRRAGATRTDRSSSDAEPAPHSARWRAFGGEPTAGFEPATPCLP
jgi:hypothetical protein